MVFLVLQITHNLSHGDAVRSKPIMATQGLVTVLSEGGVVLKVVAGSNGYNADKLAELLRKNWPITLEQAYELAQQAHFGEEASLVVIDESSSFPFTENELGPLYRQTFHQPEFNPRWKHGICEHTRIVNV